MAENLTDEFERHSANVEAIYAFMRSTRALDEQGLAELDALALSGDLRNSNRGMIDFCLMAACVYPHPEAARVLIEKYEADYEQTMRLHATGSDGAVIPGEFVTENLLHQTLSCYRLRPDADYSAMGKARLGVLVELLLEKNLSAAENSDMLCNAVYEAAMIANPDRQFDEGSPEYDWIVAALGPKDPKRTMSLMPFELIRRYQPEATAAYEDIFGPRGALDTGIEKGFSKARGFINNIAAKFGLG